VLPFYVGEAFNAYVDSSRLIGASLTLFVLDVAAERVQRRSTDDDRARAARPIDHPLPTVAN
jgi:hypothetical protein